MREELKKRDGRRGTFTAEFSRYGTAGVRIPGYGRFSRPRLIQVTTLLFRELKDSTGFVVTDHLWFKTCKAWEALGLRPGDIVKFDARVVPYQKGYQGSRDGEGSGAKMDYKLAFPTNAKLMGAFRTEFPLLGSIACQGCGGSVEDGKQLCAKCAERMD